MYKIDLTRVIVVSLSVFLSVYSESGCDSAVFVLRIASTQQGSYINLADFDVKASLSNKSD